MPLIPAPHVTAFGVVDQPPAKAKTATAAGGVATVTFDGPNAPQGWYVDRITVKARTSIANAAFPASSSQAFVYVIDAGGASQITDAQLADLSLIGNLDIADETQPIYVDAGQQLAVQWTNATNGALYTARIQYRLVLKGYVVP